MMESPSAAAPEASRAARDRESRAADAAKKHEATENSGPLGVDTEPIIRVEGLRKSYRTARGELVLFDGLNLEVKAGELVAIVGQSGTGKSTLLHILGALDAPTAGTVYFASTHEASVNVASLSPREAAAFRNREIGYVWQFHYLLPEFTAEENVAMPLMARGVRQAEAVSVAREWLR